MFVDRSVRYLSSLRGVSTSRVLNLGASGCGVHTNGGSKPQTLFQSPVISRAILVKHRVRPHEDFLFGYHIQVATKIVVPADPADLSLGGESFFVDQRGFKHKLQEIGRYPNGGLDADAETLHRIAEVPALDAFLVRAHLQSHGMDVPAGCLEISEVTRVQLEDFAVQELLGFIRTVLGPDAGPAGPITLRLVRALFFDPIGAGLEPFRAVLGLDRPTFGRAILAWRGFLYCKWQLQRARERIPEVLAGLQQLHSGSQDEGVAARVRQAKTAVAEGVFASLKRIRQLLQRYDTAYAEFIDNGRPAAFREFLLQAPRLFGELAQNTGAISHMLTFWACRFPDGVSGPVDGDELCAMLDDFESGFALPSIHACEVAATA